MADEGAAGSDAANRRSGQRRRALKGGRIIYGNLSMSMDCTVRNLSPSGARLEFEGGDAVPDEFYLFITGDHVIARVGVAWRRVAAVGVHFLEPLVHPKDHPDTRIGHLHLG
ncbi:MAG: PilZ domain-containing protein [Bauldia sp.]